MSTENRLPFPSFPRKHVLSRVEGRESRLYRHPGENRGPSPSR